MTIINPRNGALQQAARQLNQRMFDKPALRGLYKLRFEIERALNILKNVLGLGQLRARGKQAVKRHFLAVVSAFTFMAQALTQRGLSMRQIAQVAA